MKNLYVKITGMSCKSCEEKVEKSLKKIKEISKVTFNKNIGLIYYDGDIDRYKIVDAIKDAGYETRIQDIFTNFNDIKRRQGLKDLFIISLILITIYFFVNNVLSININEFIPKINNNMSLFVIFLIGLLTSIHCVGMCGGINILANASAKKKDMKSPLKYNSGRLLSYTFTGMIAGLIGSTFFINTTVINLVIIVASILMIVIGLSMLRIINFKLGNILPNIKYKGSSPFIIGLLNGFMPCGPLQAMQLYAVATGSFIMGALAMFFFGLGTIPLMFLLGYLVSTKNNKIVSIIARLSPVLIILMALLMLTRSLTGLGINLKVPSNYDHYTRSKIINNVQYVTIQLTSDGYEDIVVQKGIPVKMNIKAERWQITSCNSTVVSKVFKFKKDLVPGDNIIEFTPKKTGRFIYSCWMNMIKNEIRVIDNRKYFE